ncbi:MAG TPA: TatD family hydrolase [Anaerolineales bacterium]|nr:TatD family hydrolase [Anaerolineales bacterium]
MIGDESLLVDSHCHLTLPEFQGDFEEVLERAAEAGVTKLLVPGIDLESSRRAVSLSDRYPVIYAAVGVHPHAASTWGEETERALVELLRAEHVVAIGEIGLDYFRNLSPPDAQRVAFQAQLRIAAESGLPVVIHNREAMPEILSITLEWAAGLSESLRGRAGVMHAFSSDTESASKAIQAGFYLGVAGPITYPNAHDRRDLAVRVPLNRLLIETDSPYLPPQPFRGKRNEPALVRIVAQALAEVRSISLEETARATSANAVTLFRWEHGTDNSHIL